MSHSVLLGSLALMGCLDRRKHIRNHIRMVMEQLEEVLAELKDVARQLREVVDQIDKLTDDIDLDSKEDTSHDKVTLDCSNNSSERALGEFSKETFSESHSLGHLLQNSYLDTPKSLYRRSCGDIPTLNRPVWVSYSPKPFWLSGRGKNIHYCDNASYHALCCNDDDLDKDHSDRRSRFLSSDSVFSSSSLQPVRVDVLTPTSTCKYHQSSRLNKKAVKSCSTQTVSDKSTQTALSHSPDKQRSSSEHEH